MALWRNGMRFLFVGLSGLKYETTIRCGLPRSHVEAVVLEFFQSRKVVLDTASSVPGVLRFPRGSRWLGRLSWLLFLSEKWAFQTITATVTEKEKQVAEIQLIYDVWLFLTLIVPPNQLEKEATALRAKLEAEKSA